MRQHIAEHARSIAHRIPTSQANSTGALEQEHARSKSAALPGHRSLTTAPADAVHTPRRIDPPRTRRLGSDDQIRRWLEDPTIGSDELSVLVALSRFANFETGVCWPSGETLRRLLGRDGRAWAKKRLQAVVERLVDNGHLTIRHRRSASGRNAGIEYKLLGGRYTSEPITPEFRGGTVNAVQGSDPDITTVPHRNPLTESPKQNTHTALPRDISNIRNDEEGSVVTLMTRDWTPACETSSLVAEQLPELDQEQFLRRFRLQHCGKGMPDPDGTYRRWAAAERACRKRRYSGEGRGLVTAHASDLSSAKTATSSARSTPAGRDVPNHGTPVGLPRHPSLERVIASYNHFKRLELSEAVVRTAPKTANPIIERNSLARDIQALSQRMVSAGLWPAG